MKIVRECLIRLDDEYDLTAATELGHTIAKRAVGNWPKERQADVIVCYVRNQARKVIAELNSRANALRTKAKRSATATQ